MGWIMGPWEMVGAGCARRDRGPLRGRAGLARARPRVGVGRAHRVNVLGVSPTLIRALKTAGRRARAQARPLEPARLRLDRRAVEPRALPWLSEVVGGGRVPIINISGGTEVGRLLPDALSGRGDQGLLARRRRRTAWTSTSSTTDGQPGARRGRRARLQAALAGDDARHLGRPRPLHRDLLVDVRGRLAPRRLGADRRGRATGSCSAAPTTRSTSPASGSARPRSSRCSSRTRRWRSRPSSACPTRPRARRSGASACSPTAAASETAEELRELVAQRAGPPVQAVARRVRRGAAEDALGEDPAPRGARGRGRRGPRRHVLGREPAGARRHPRRARLSARRGGRAGAPLGGDRFVDQAHQALDRVGRPLDGSGIDVLRRVRGPVGVRDPAAVVQARERDRGMALRRGRGRVGADAPDVALASPRARTGARAARRCGPASRIPRRRRGTRARCRRPSRSRSRSVRRASSRRARRAIARMPSAPRRPRR